MEYLRICFCKSCKALDYADRKCPRCGSRDITEASIDFLRFGNMERFGKKLGNMGYYSGIQIYE